MKPLLIAVLFFTAVLAERRGSPDTSVPSAIVGGDDVRMEFSAVAKILAREPKLTRSWTKEDKWISQCTGALIHRRWIITAAHCFEEDTTYRDIAICMQSDGCSDGGWRKASVFEPRSSWVFDDDDSSSWIESQSDQALIRLSYSVSGSDPLPIATTTPGVAFTGVQVGWGLTKWEPDMDREDMEWPDTLQTLPVLARREANFDILTLFDPVRIILKRYESHVAPGDSGGPLCMWTLKGWTLVGVLATQNVPNGYSTNSAITQDILDWIDETMDEHGDRR